MSLVTGLFFLVLLLNQRWSLPLRLQASHCSTFRIMCDVLSIDVFCSESIECFPGTASMIIIIIIIIRFSLLERKRVLECILYYLLSWRLIVMRFPNMVYNRLLPSLIHIWLPNKERRVYIDLFVKLGLYAAAEGRTARRERSIEWQSWYRFTCCLL